MSPSRFLSGGLGAVALAFGLVVVTTLAPAGAQTTDGFDISYPQCPNSFPQVAPGSAAVAIVGVNGGRVYLANSCLAGELDWAYRAAVAGAPAYYANTGNPGPKVSKYWPSGQQTPRVCATRYPYNDSTSCAYDYGWNAAKDSYGDAVAAEQQHDSASGSTFVAPASRRWWLDVENSNSWETLEYGSKARFQANDTASVQGAIDYLASLGATVGVYSTGYQWGQITGGAALNVSVPDWVAGAADATQAAAYCTGQSFTGPGAVTALTQYQSGGFDVDHPCA